MINLYGSNGLISPFYKNVVEAVFNNTHRFITLKGGRFSAKGDTVYTLMLITLSQKQGEGRIYVPIQRNIKTGVLKQVIKVIKRIGIDCKVNMSDYSITLNNGSKIYFNGLDANKSTVNTDLTKGSDSDLEHGILFCIFDEIAALAEFERLDDIIDTLIRQPECMFFEVSNPPQNKASKLLKRYSEQSNDDKYLVIHSTVANIPIQWVNQGQIDLINKYKQNNPKRFEHAILGLSTGTDGLAFVVDESIWTNNTNNYIEFHVQTDEATANATAFGLFGLTSGGELHLITIWYHSPHRDGIKHAPSTYAYEFDLWLQNFGASPQTITTDGIAFAVELQKFGYDAQSIANLKDRPLSYLLLDKLIMEGSFKIVDAKENIIFYNQLTNAQKEFNSKGEPMISKRKESASYNEDYHAHALDLALYQCLKMQRQILRGEV